MGLLDRLLPRRDSRPLAALARRDHWGTASPGGRWVGPGGQGGITDRTAQTSWDPGYPVDQWLADALLSANPLARRIASQEPEDATREGYDLVGLDSSTADAVEQACEGGEQGRGLGLLSVLARARTWARAYGGGALVLLVDDGRPYDQPIDMANIRRVRGVLDADRYELTVQRYGQDRDEPQTWGRPQLYRLNLNRGGGVGQVATVHADRVVRIDGVPLPRRLQLQRQGWDGSIFDQCFSALRNYGATLDQVAEAVSMLNQGVLTSEALAEGLETDHGPAIWDARMQALRKGAGLYNDVALGKGETYAVHNRSMSGLGEAVLALEDALIASADGMPRLVLLGKLTAGFSNGSDGELRAWYDTVAARQPRHYTPAIQAVVDLVMLSHEGPTGGQRLPYSVEWRPLWALSELEQAQRDLARAQRRSVDIMATVVSAAETRAEPSVVELYGINTGPAALAPATSETDLPETDLDLPDETAVADLALNGAQAQALVGIVQAVALGEIPRASGVAIVAAMLPARGVSGAEAIIATAGANPPPGSLADLPDQPVASLDDDTIEQAAPSVEMPPADLVSAKDVGALFGMPTVAITKLIATGQLPYWGLGKHKRVSMAAVAALAKSHENEPS